MASNPRVTLGIATYNRDTYLIEAIESCLSQDYESLEVLVVLDGSTNPRIDEIVASYADDPRFRSVRHEINLGIAAAYNTFISEGRGELIAMLGDDDVCEPGRIRRQVEVFDRYPETGVVHGDAIVIDAAGDAVGDWRSSDFTQSELIRSFYRRHNYLIDPTRMVRRAVYEQVGGYDTEFRVAQDFEFWLRAARHFRFRHRGGDPLIRLRRHGANESDESQRDAEAADVSRALERSLALYPLRELVPELDWPVLEPIDAERQALVRLAEFLSQRAVPVPELSTRLRQQAAELQPPPPARNGKRLLMTMFGWNDSGGGTFLPRLVAKELVRRGWEVSVFHAATSQLPAEPPYATHVWNEDGVRLVGIHNRPSWLFDIGNPLRELDDPQIRSAFRTELEQFRPDVVHFHNLHNLGASLIDEAAQLGIETFFTTHNYWLVCQRAYLMHADGQMCPGPGDGSACATCTGSYDARGYKKRLREIRGRVSSSVSRVLAVSDAVRQTLIACGYPADAIDTVRQAMPHENDIWRDVGRDRVPGRSGTELTVAFVGSAYPHKGPQLLVQAAQRTEATVRIKIVGEVQAQFRNQLLEIDRRGVVEFTGPYSATELPGILAGVDAAALPSAWWDCAPLAATECRAARLPLLVPRLGGLPETVRDDVDGLTFAGLDVDDLARQLDRLASEPGLLERLQAAIPPPGSFAAHVDELEAYYDGTHPEVVHAPPAPDAIEVRWHGDHGVVASLPIINDAITARFPGRVQRVDRKDAPLDAPLSHGADVEVHHEWPPNLSPPPPAGRFATIVPWEFGAVPRMWINDIQRNVDELWVPSEFVRAMYVSCGVEPERVEVIPNGVDLEIFSPAQSAAEAGDDERLRFLFVGGISPRKGHDVLVKAWDEAFAGRDDVVLVIKAALGGGAYKVTAPLRERVDQDLLPQIELIDDDLDAPALADLYRRSDVFVLSYRAEGFVMPALEAMACGLPTILTGGGPTDEFCPPDAGWRIRAERMPVSQKQLANMETVGEPWWLEPDQEHLVEILREVASCNRAELRRRGAIGRRAAEAFSWDAVARRYEERITALAARPTRRVDRVVGDFPFEEAVDLRVLATPAWRGTDRLDQLLREWAACTSPQSSACLYLLADPMSTDGPEQIEAHVLEVASHAGVDLNLCADINVLMEPLVSDRDRRLHQNVSAYVTLHPGCSGHERLALAAGARLIVPGTGGLAQLVSGSLSSAVE